MPALKRRRKPEDEILDLDYLAHNSSLDGMLSHLKPELRTAFQETGSSLPALNPVVYQADPIPNTPALMRRAGDSDSAPQVSLDTPMGLPPMGLSLHAIPTASIASDEPAGLPPSGLSVPTVLTASLATDAPMGLPPVGPSTVLASTSLIESDTPVGLPPMGLSDPLVSITPLTPDTPMGLSPVGPSTVPASASLTESDAPVGLPPMGLSVQLVSSAPIAAHTPLGPSTAPPSDPPTESDGPMGRSPMGLSVRLAPTPDSRRDMRSSEATRPFSAMESAPIEDLDLFESPTSDPHQPSDATPSYDIAGVGKRRFHRCRTVQDGHTNGEQVAYTTIWSYAKRSGHHEQEGCYLVDLSIARLCQLISTDHKHARKLLNNLQLKLSIEIARQPNFRLNSPTTYRVFNYSQILERRNAAGLIWVVRNRATQFVSPEQVRMIVGDPPMGRLPMGGSGEPIEEPMGRRPEEPSGRKPEAPTGQRPPALLIKENSSRKPEVRASSSAFPSLLEALRNHMGMVDDDAARKIISGCLANCHDATDTEMAMFAEQQAKRIRTMKGLTNPVGLLIKQIPKCFEGEAFHQYREAESRRLAADRQEREDLARRVLANKGSDPNSLAWARSILGVEPS